MPSIGHVQRQNDGSFRGALKTLSVNAEIAIIPNRSKTGDQPDYRVLTQGIEVGAGWIRTGETSGRDYVSLSIAAPEFGPRRLYANLGRVPGEADETFAVIWNPYD